MSAGPYGFDDLMVGAATRYCLGRSTYIVSACADWLIDLWPNLTDHVRTGLRQDIERAFAKDDADREAGREHCALGHDMDRADWERVRRLWVGE